MQILTSYEDVPDTFQNAHLAIGNFDGLHVGHRRVIEGVRQVSKHEDAPWGVLMFDPSPRKFFSKSSEFNRIMSLTRRSKILEKLGASVVFALPFDTKIAAMTDDEFVQTVLTDGLNVASVSIGYDFCFGKNRMGNATTMNELGAKFGFGVQVAPKVSTDSSTEITDKVSSTDIRRLIGDGKVSEAASLLTDYWTVEAKVEHGEKRGRTIGFPTANLYLHEFVTPKIGVYAVWVRCPGDSTWRKGVANYGRTPTTGERSPLLEVHILGFDGDIYGQDVEIGFVEFIRDEEKFDSFQDLVAQIAKDRDTAESLLKTVSQPKV
jgi:riboflavin kinase/FMN adenylyltransferase